MRGRLGRAVRVAFGLGALALAVVALSRNWAEFTDGLASLSLLAVILAAAFGLVAAWVSMLGWRTLLVDGGRDVAVPQAARMFFVGQMAKYVPGSVWTFAAQAELGRDHEISARRSVGVLGLTLMISTCSALIVALVFLGASGQLPGPYSWAFLAIPLFLVALHPSTLTRVAAAATRLLGRQQSDPVQVSRRSLLLATSCAVGAFVLLGIQGAILAVDLDGWSVDLVARTVGGVALAWGVGVLVIVAPAGAGVREAVMVVVLTPALSQGDALVVALIARVLAIFADLALAGASILGARVSHGKRALNGGSPR